MDLVPKRFRIESKALGKWDECPVEKAGVGWDTHRVKEEKQELREGAFGKGEHLVQHSEC